MSKHLPPLFSQENVDRYERHRRAEIARRRWEEFIRSVCGYFIFVALLLACLAVTG